MGHTHLIKIRLLRVSSYLHFMLKLSGLVLVDVYTIKYTVYLACMSLTEIFPLIVLLVLFLCYLSLYWLYVFYLLTGVSKSLYGPHNYF